MGRYKFNIALFFTAVLAVSCAIPKSRTAPAVPEDQAESKAVEGPVRTETAEFDQTPPPVNDNESEELVQAETAEFGTVSVMPQVYRQTKQELYKFIRELNSIIKARRYEVWMRYIDSEYYQYINSPDYLREISKSKILAAKKIVLSDSYDYFIHVIVPSRSNDRLDEIEFTGENRVKAINIRDGRRIVLYDLEKTQNGWKIVMPNFTR
ncbi:MAG: hypothetical protein LBO04_02990 [Spirochaetaceae bacterium]|nr:hypothetical protein [Spirochaetaceae bacterium]